MRFFGKRAWMLTLAAMLVTFASCKRENAAGSTGIKITGSDTMVNLASAWREDYGKKNADIAIQVSGGGSGVGIARLCAGELDIATSSRPMKEKEIELAKKNTGKTPVEFKVGLDALAIYVSKNNPIESISIADLAGIYGVDGKIETWKDLGVENTACPDGQIVRVSRQNSSGTYQYFKEAILGEKGEYKQGALSQSGSSDVVALVEKTPCAIGYSGMGYRTPEVKLLPVSREKGEPAIAPSTETALDGSYPISRPLFIYTLGEPTGHLKAFIDWVLSPEGQAIVEKVGYVPNPQK